MVKTGQFTTKCYTLITTDSIGSLLLDFYLPATQHYRSLTSTELMLCDINNLTGVTVDRQGVEPANVQ